MGATVVKDDPVTDALRFSQYVVIYNAGSLQKIIPRTSVLLCYHNIYNSARLRWIGHWESPQLIAPHHMKFIQNTFTVMSSEELEAQIALGTLELFRQFPAVEHENIVELWVRNGS